MKKVGVCIPDPWVKALDFLVRWDKSYPNRSEAIRMAIRDLLRAELGDQWCLTSSMTTSEEDKR